MRRRIAKVAALTTAAILGSLHLLIIGGTILAPGGSSESQRFLLLTFDLPFVILSQRLLGGRSLYGSPSPIT